jgi:hypothetical protein
MFDKTIGTAIAKTLRLFISCAIWVYFSLVGASKNALSLGQTIYLDYPAMPQHVRTHNAFPLY